jgi:hypothetical protein
MRVSRRLFVVPLADNNYGKSTLIRALVGQGRARNMDALQHGVQRLQSSTGRRIDALIFPRSYQESEKQEHGSVYRALDTVDSEWRTRALVILPSHLDIDDIREIVRTARRAGFDAVAAVIVIPELDDRTSDRLCDSLGASWDLRWTINNPRSDDWEGQVQALGRDLWTWICRGIEH